MSRRLPWIGLLAAGAVALLLGPGVRADDGATGKPVAGTWVYDVRVVRVDASEPSVVEAAPTWKQAGGAGATTTAGWAEILATLKTRGRATVLLDQRLTSTEGVVTVFRQQRRRPVLSLLNRIPTSETWSASFIETGTKGELVPQRDGLSYSLEVSWEEAPKPDGSGPLGEVSWKGSRSSLPTGETLVLSHRQQQLTEAGPEQGLEIYAFVTGSLLPAR